MTEAALLVELLTEELPPKSLKILAEVFADRIWNGLVQRQLQQRVPGLDIFATPRRLAVRVPEVNWTAEDRENEISGPPANAPSQAIAGFAKKHGVPVDQLERRPSPKGEVVVARIRIKGAKLDSVLQQIEAHTNSLVAAFGTSTVGVLSTGTPSPVILSSAPSLRITAVGGVAAPANPTGYTLNGVPC